MILSSANTNLSEDIEEDFELIDLNDITEPLKFFHKMIRTKYYKRIEKKDKELRFKEKSSISSRFEIILDSDDYYAFYQNNYKDLKEFMRQVDDKLFNNLYKQIRDHRLSKGEIEKDTDSDKKKFSLDIERVVREFKLLIEILEDIYKRAYLYNLIDLENLSYFHKFDIKCSNIQDIMISFFLSKLCATINKVSHKLVSDVVVILISRIAKIKISFWALLLPDIEIFNIQNRVKSKVETLLFSSVFTKQREQIQFLFVTLNQMVSDHIDELKNCINCLYSEDKALDRKSYDVYTEVLNCKFDEINNIKFEKLKGNKLNLYDLCKITDVDIKQQKKMMKMDQELAEVDVDFIENNNFESDFNSAINLTQKKPENRRKQNHSPQRETFMNTIKDDTIIDFITSDISRIDIEQSLEQRTINNFEIIDFMDEF